MKSIAIVGGGVAGLAAGCALADAGHKVTLFERKPYLGGRASSYEHPGTGEVVDNCQHVLFGCCTNLLDLYKRIGVEGHIQWFPSMTLITPDGVQSELKASWLPAPFHTALSFARARYLGWRDKLSIARGIAAIIFRPPEDDGRSFLDWLVEHRQTERAIRRFWGPVLVSALSEELDRCSVPYAAMVFREAALKSARAGRQGVPSLPLSELYARGKKYIEEHGGTVRLRTPVEEIKTFSGGVVLKLGLEGAGEEFAADDVVVAAPWFTAAKLAPEFSAMLKGIESSSITGIHLWFDRKITDLPHAALLDRTIQWMYHKSLLHPERDQSASYVELVVSASKGLIERSRQEIIDIAVRELGEFFPKVREAKLEKATVVKELNATFSVVPGGEACRPSQKTTVPHLFLAGDWTATGWPSTMEGAARSGYLAAEAIAGKKFMVADLPARGLMRMFGAG